MPKNIGKTLKDCRTSAKMTVKEISDLLTEQGYKASESTIYSWENDNSQPTPGALLSMCIAYGIDDVLSTFGYNGYKDDGSIQLNLVECEIIEKYRNLDGHGKKMVDIVLNEEYSRCAVAKKVSKEPSYLRVQAAHERTDIKVTEDMRKHDDDIMNDPDF